MQFVCPDYYNEFHCIAGACKHSCCIGWEIDIDPDKAELYKNVPGEVGRRLKENIHWGEVPHFILREGERCPFLNERNLCDLILELGEEHICSICTEHPRFYNELPDDRLEVGLGLCCEEAARLILGKKEPVTLEYDCETGEEDVVIVLRDEAIAILQERDKSVDERVWNMLQLCGASGGGKTVGQWAQMLLGLERLDEEWTRLLNLLLAEGAQADHEGFDVFMQERQTEYEQLLVYLVYRHMVNAVDEADLAARAGFAALGYELLRAMGAVIWTQTGEFTFEQQVELARLFSSEIEYSDENLNILLEELSQK